MRFLIDILVGLMLLGLAAGAFLHFRTSNNTANRTERTRMELRRFQSQLDLKAALGEAELSTAGFPLDINIEWFGDSLPSNPLLPLGHPWVEIAPESQQSLDHPLDRSATDRSLAQFWYNPYRGALRARVPSKGTDTETLILYNTVNDSSLPGLFAAGESE